MIKLINIEPERDGRLAAGWINAPGGAQMLQLMGMLVPDDFTTTVDDEQNRLTEIKDSPNELAWMVSYDNRVIGIVELHTKDVDGLSAPHLSIMIGAADIRGKGVGTEVIRQLIGIATAAGYKKLYARALTRNVASHRMMMKAGFVLDGGAYIDDDGLNWQNYLLDL